jgi:mRNA interferase HigB
MNREYIAGASCYRVSHRGRSPEISWAQQNFSILWGSPEAMATAKAIREASAKHTEWSASLNAWFKITKGADWNNFTDVRSSWKNSDSVGRFVVFDISHNRCRLIATIQYEWQMVYIRRILSHAEYDGKEWRKG